MNKCPINLDDTPEICSAGTCDKCIGRKMKWLQSELSAAKAREAELREKLATLEVNAQAEIDRLNAQIIDRDTKLEAAEAKLKEISEAPVVAYGDRLGTHWERVYCAPKTELPLWMSDMTPLIIRPTIKE